MTPMIEILTMLLLVLVYFMFIEFATHRNWTLTSEHNCLQKQPRLNHCTIMTICIKISQYTYTSLHLYIYVKYIKMTCSLVCICFSIFLYLNKKKNEMRTLNISVLLFESNCTATYNRNLWQTESLMSEVKLMD